ncbi:helix-turn-helix domain-containing protein [Aeromicrobium sp. CTD01-1L150]|uniref:helix-turn-helix domain-containing protein n=1 Tax=Aeromicrobium sp. CTD01-1L150 TaxID=3341830 RepID=UPI0035C20EF3
MTSTERRQGLRDVSAVLGQRVRKRREALGLSQEELAHRSGLSRNQVQNLEKNRNNSRDANGRTGPANPRLDTLWSIATTLEITVSELLDGIDRP